MSLTEQQADRARRRLFRFVARIGAALARGGVVMAFREVGPWDDTPMDIEANKHQFRLLLACQGRFFSSWYATDFDPDRWCHHPSAAWEVFNTIDSWLVDHAGMFDRDDPYWDDMLMFDSENAGEAQRLETLLGKELFAECVRLVEASLPADDGESDELPA